MSPRSISTTYTDVSVILAKSSLMQALPTLTAPMEIVVRRSNLGPESYPGIPPTVPLIAAPLFVRECKQNNSYNGHYISFDPFRAVPLVAESLAPIGEIQRGVAQVSVLASIYATFHL